MFIINLLILIFVTLVYKTISKNDNSISFSLSSKFTNLTSSINHKNQPLSLRNNPQLIQKRSRHAESPLFITDDQEDYFCSEGYYPSRKY